MRKTPFYLYSMIFGKNKAYGAKDLFLSGKLASFTNFIHVAPGADSRIAVSIPHCKIGYAMLKYILYRKHKTT